MLGRTIGRIAMCRCFCTVMVGTCIHGPLENYCCLCQNIFVEHIMALYVICRPIEISIAVSDNMTSILIDLSSGHFFVVRTSNK